MANSTTTLINANIFFAAASIFSSTDCIAESNANSEEGIIVNERIVRRPSSTLIKSKDSFSLDKLKSNKRRLEAFNALDDNWNGYGASPLSSELIQKIEFMIENMEIQPSIFPTGRDSIQLEWRKGADNLLEVEIFENGDVEYFLKKSELEQEGSILDDSISEKVYEFNA